MSYHPNVFEINYEHYAIPTSFKDFDDNGEPRLEHDVTHARSFIPADFLQLDEDYDDACREVALRTFRDEWELRCTFGFSGDLHLGNKQFLVLTDSEADDTVKKILQDYVDDHLPDEFRSCFNESDWIEKQIDAMTRGHWLSPYDHIENKQETVTGTYFIYRQR